MIRKRKKILQQSKQIKKVCQESSGQGQSPKNEKVPKIVEFRFCRLFRSAAGRCYLIFFRGREPPIPVSSTLEGDRLERNRLRDEPDALRPAFPEQDPRSGSDEFRISDESELDGGSLAALDAVVGVDLFDDGRLTNVADVDGGAEPGEDLLRVVEQADAGRETHRHVVGLV